MNIAFLCPGQSSQKVGMGLDLYENTTLGKDYFDRANDIMGLDIQDIIFLVNKNCKKHYYVESNSKKHCQ